MSEPSETSKRLARLALMAEDEIHEASPETLPERSVVTVVVAAALDVAGVREAEDFIQKCSERYWQMGSGGKSAADDALAALRGSKALPDDHNPDQYDDR